MTPLFKEDKEIEDNNLINNKLLHSPNSMAGEIYEFKIDTFELGKTEERIQVLTDVGRSLSTESILTDY